MLKAINHHRWHAAWLLTALSAQAGSNKTPAKQPAFVTLNNTGISTE